MRIVRYHTGGSRAARYGILEHDQVHEIAGTPFGGETEKIGVVHSRSDLQLLAPCEPTKIVAGGLNYRSHAIEMNLAIPTEPVFFLKPPTSITGSGSVIDFPPQSSRLEYEAELAVIIGTAMYKTPVEEVRKGILGYTCSNDITARDIQARGGNLVNLTYSKAFNTFCPIGPWIETEVEPGALDIVLTVNGKVRQTSNTGDMLFSVEEMVSYFSHIMTLLPGDVVLTGTPFGVGEIKSGDIVNVTIDGIGTLTNTIGPQ